MAQDFIGNAKQQRQLEEQAAIEKSQQVGTELQAAIAKRKELFRSQMDVIEPLLEEMAANVKANGGDSSTKDSAAMFNGILQFYGRDLRFQIPNATNKGGPLPWYIVRVSPTSAGAQVEVLKHPHNTHQVSVFVPSAIVPADAQLSAGIAAIFTEALKRII